jgi:hypothetical protein
MNFMPWPLNLQEGTQYPLNRRLGGSWSESGYFEEEKTLLPYIYLYV